MKKFLVTGSSGFIGSRLCSTMATKGFSIRAVKRNEDSILPSCCKDFVLIGERASSAEWSLALNGIDVIIHLAGRAHVMKEDHESPLEEYRRINVEGTRKIVEAAANKSIKRIIYLSTIKVNGESTAGKPFDESDLPEPQDAYARSKFEAEECMKEISEMHGIEFVVLRSPLVYGPGVKGNLLKLMKYIKRGMPLPLGGLENKRSMISLDNLVDALILSGTRAECAGHTFLISDGNDLSTTQLVRTIATAMDRNIRLMPYPKALFSIASWLRPSFRSLSERLAGSLVVNSSKFRRMLQWTPPQTIADGVEDMVAHFLGENKNVR